MARLPGAHDWDGFWQKNAGGGKTPSLSKQRVMAFLKPYLKAGGRALDAGCGSGFFSGFFCDAGQRATALDYSAVSLERTLASTQGRAATLQADLLKEELSTKVSERYDLIFSDGLFEHFVKDDQDRIMRNLRAVLAADGVIVTVVPNKFSPWEIIRPFYMPGIEEDPFTKGMLLDLNSRNGLKVVRFKGLNTLPWKISPEGHLADLCGMLLVTAASQ